MTAQSIREPIVPPYSVPRLAARWECSERPLLAEHCGQAELMVSRGVKAPAIALTKARGAL